MLITFSTGNTIEFLYDAAGNKLRKTTKTGATVQYVQDYFPGGIEYRQTGTGAKRVESVYHAEARYYNTNVDTSNTPLVRVSKPILFCFTLKLQTKTFSVSLYKSEQQ